jgi:hypothetical protein
MGEAKRRRQLDPNYGKKLQINFEDEIRKLVDEGNMFEANVMISCSLTKSLGLPWISPSIEKIAAVHHNLYTEYYFLDIGNDSSIFATARKKLFHAVIVLIELGNCGHNLLVDGLNIQISEAGKALDECNSMHDSLVWSFIPKNFHQEISLLWDGIGDWQA